MENNTRSARRGWSKKAACLSVTAALALTAFAGIGAATTATTVNAVSAEDYGLVENIQDGVILHCFDWKYTDIKAELPAIAKAGFSSIQTSPVQPAAGTGPWYWLYQPLSFTVAEKGDLGTAEELKDLCDEAEKYGIKVVVDVVANHLAGDHTNIQSDLAADEFWHTDGPITTYRDRYMVTHGDLGMTDLNSENEYVQQVVAGLIDDLKAMGVDGIRWDAAKHIGLPSEGCQFWPAVTASGLYNYGEILGSPVDGAGEAEMLEYTKYMSVTDTSYSSYLVTAFKSGTAPSGEGDWTEEGVARNKLVFWGESHDNYSNGEGKETNGVSQNVIDRAYAVAAAREGSSALYLSRPFAVARDSIRVGVKGSTHFMAPEIAAVNHFHNAMVGKAEKVAVSDNCTVVARENGGAVIVRGKGSGSVNVENAGGFVPEGTYYDEVTGNAFTVTATSITGTVGESGIAVIYNAPLAGNVYADKDSDTSFTDSMKVTLHAVLTEDAAYTVTNEAGDKTYAQGSFKDGDEITVGAEAPADSKVVLTLTCTNKSGKTVTAVYNYVKNAARLYPVLEAGGVVLDNSIANWSTVNVYVYDETDKANTITNANWPGVKMTDCGDGYFSYLLPEQFASCKNIMVIFNNGEGDQIPGQMQAGLTMAYTDKKLYDGTKWMNLPENPKPVEESSQTSEESSQTSQTSQSGTETSAAEQTSQQTTSATSASSTIVPDGKTIPTSDSTPFVAVTVVAVGAAAAAAYLLLSKKKRED